MSEVKKEDVLIEITNFDSISKPKENEVVLTTTYDIIRVDQVKGDLGRIEYNRVIARNPSPIGNQDYLTLNLV